MTDILKNTDKLGEAIRSGEYDDRALSEMVEWEKKITDNLNIKSLQELEGIKLLIKKLNEDIAKEEKSLLEDYDLSEVERKIIFRLRDEKRQLLRIFTGADKRLEEYNKLIEENL